MKRQKFPWTAWWYSAISVGFLLLAINRAIQKDRLWLIGLRIVISAGFAVLAAFEFRAKKRKR